MKSQPIVARRTAGYATATAVFGIVSVASLLLDQPLSILAAAAAFLVGALALNLGAVHSRTTALLALGGLGLASFCALVWTTWLLGAD